MILNSEPTETNLENFCRAQTKSSKNPHNITKHSSSEGLLTNFTSNMARI